ncbi:MAG: chemotaxis protein CheW [Ilumatobacteraceae bacterium]
MTEVSGRGVGMDVVRTNIERIGGSVNVSTVLGEGSTFTFMIPLTLAIIPALLVTIGHHRYAIPQTSLVELVRLTGDDCETSIENMHGVDVYRLRGRLLPIVDAATTLGVPHPPPRPGRRRLQIAVLQADGREFGLVVDDIHGTEEIVVKPVGAHYTGIGVRRRDHPRRRRRLADRRRRRRGRACRGGQRPSRRSRSTRSKPPCSPATATCST